MAVCETAFVSDHLNTDHSQLTKCFALVVCFACCSLSDSTHFNSAATANHAKSAKHMVDYFSNVLFLTCTHLHQHKCQGVVESPLFKETV